MEEPSELLKYVVSSLTLAVFWEVLLYKVKAIFLYMLSVSFQIECATSDFCQEQVWLAVQDGQLCWGRRDAAVLLCSLLEILHVFLSCSPVATLDVS